MWRRCMKFLQKLLEEGDIYITDFWKGVRPEEAKRNIINLPNTIEELKEAEKVQNDVIRALECYNKFLPRNQYFKPHTANAKKFLNHAEFINMQLNFYYIGKECINSFLGIEKKEVLKLLQYYWKPREILIKNYYEESW